MNGNHGKGTRAGFITLMMALGANLVIFIHQANAFAGIFKGDWKTLFVIILGLEVLLTSIYFAVASIYTGTGGSSSSSSFTEGATITVGTTAIYGWGFWWVMDFLSRIFGLGSEPNSTALAVFFLIVPGSQILTCFVNVFWCALVTHLVDFCKKK